MNSQDVTKPAPVLPVAAGSPDALLEEVWGDELADDDEATMSWLWQGYLAPGCITLLTSQWKSGKTTLVSVFLSRLQAGGQLAGLPLAAGKAIVVSEEGKKQWRRRGRQLAFGRQVCLICRPFRGKPRPEQWLALLNRLAVLHERHGFNLVVFDTLASFLPGRDENTAGTIMTYLAPLLELAERNLSILLLHHPRKGENLAGQAARGSGALPAFVDIVLEMDWCGRFSLDDRRRRRGPGNAAQSSSGPGTISVAQRGRSGGLAADDPGEHPD